MSWAPYEHPSGKYFIFASNKLGFENFELFMVDTAGTKEPVRVTYSDGFDGLPVPSPDGRQLAWTSSRGGGTRRPDVPRAVESREGARGASRNAPLQEKPRPSHEDTRRSSSPLCARRGRSSTRIRQPARRSTSQTRAHVETLASERFEGRLTGTDGERSRGDYIVVAAARIGAKPLPGQQRLSMRRSSSPPARATAGRPSTSAIGAWRVAGAVAVQRQRRAGALVL